jgi:hypothetical protein
MQVVVFWPCLVSLQSIAANLAPRSAPSLAPPSNCKCFFNPRSGAQSPHKHSLCSCQFLSRRGKRRRRRLLLHMHEHAPPPPTDPSSRYVSSSSPPHLENDTRGVTRWCPSLGLLLSLCSSLTFVAVSPLRSVRLSPAGQR